MGKDYKLRDSEIIPVSTPADAAPVEEPSFSEASIRLYKAVQQENVPVEVNSWDLAAVLNALSDALATHPEDAPGGPWKIGSTLDQDEFIVKSKSGFLGPFTWERAVAHCNALNRLKGDER